MKRPPVPSLPNLLLLLMILSSTLAWAQTPPAPFPGQAQLLGTYVWDLVALEQRVKDTPQVTVAVLPDQTLKITNAGDRACSLVVFTIPTPPITQDFYALQGQLSFQDVSGDGYLEMWNNFPGGRAFFSRTLAPDPRQPMGKVSGSSVGFRPVTLPFNATGSGSHPESLSVAVVLPGAGTVIVSALELYQYVPPVASTGPGASNAHSQAGPFVPAKLFNGLLAGGVLLAGASLCFNWLAKQQRGRAFVVTSAWTLMALGIVVLAAGIHGWLDGWPAPVWRSLLLGGLAVSGWFASAAYRFQQAYRSAEWRRITAFDA